MVKNMSYKITKKTNLKIEYYGYETTYHIDFTFKKQKCNVTIEIYNDRTNEVRLSSNTDGYHWLQYFLCQEPNCDNLLNLPFDEEIKRINDVFNKFDILYEQEGKETAWLKTSKDINEKFVDVVAKIIEPRFANRERFFET